MSYQPHGLGCRPRAWPSLHRFYHHCRVLGADTPELESARLRLVDATRIVLARGLALLGIAAPEEM